MADKQLIDFINSLEKRQEPDPVPEPVRYDGCKRRLLLQYLEYADLNYVRKIRFEPREDSLRIFYNDREVSNLLMDEPEIVTELLLKSAEIQGDDSIRINFDNKNFIRRLSHRPGEYGDIVELGGLEPDRLKLDE